MADREDLLDQLTGDAPAADTTETQAEYQTIGDGDPDVGGGETAAMAYPDKPEAPESPLETGDAAAFLDSLTEGAEVKKPDAEPASGAPTADPAATATPKTDQPAPEKTLDEQEAELLEGVKSERGRERIKAVFADRKALAEERAALESDINEFREMVKSTGATPDEFAASLEYLKLVHANDEGSARMALEMIEAQRAELCRRLGMDAPGIDVLADFPDLKAEVEQMGMRREVALEVAKYRRQQAEQQAVQRSQQMQQQERAQWDQTVGQVTETAKAYFATREKEADFPAKLAQLKTKFSDPAFMNEFVSTYQPQQWFGVIKMMYDTISVAPAPRQVVRDQPIRARTAVSGSPALKADAPPADRLMSHLDSMGI